MSSKSPGPKRKQLIVKVLMLDDSEVPFQIESKTTGNELTNLVYQYLKLIESDYFGLEFIDSKGKKCWLDYDKPVSKQIQNNSKLIFCVKFYTPDPGQLEEEYTRYLYALQIKRDLAEGLLLCSDATASLLVSYILQAEIGDYVDTYNNSTSYFQNRLFFPHQNEEHEAKILDYHKNHIGQSPADADLNLLDIARKIELYGIIMHPAKDHEGVQLNLAVAHMGILVFQNFTKINTFSWAKIRKLSFKRKKFLVKLHPENYGFYKDTVEFYFDNRDDSKNFWKKCIEHHSFFRCISTQRMPRQKSKLLTRGSSFRYYGRTQKELIENARENFSKNRSFDRSYHSMRSISQFGGGANIGAAGSMQISGTQSLNRNLASRSTGAILVPTSGGGGGSSTLSSNDSAQHFHTYNQNQSSSTHHLSYYNNNNNGNNTNNGVANKSATLQSQNNLEKLLPSMNRSLNENVGSTSVSSLNHNQAGMGHYDTNQYQSGTNEYSHYQGAYGSVTANTPHVVQQKHHHHHHHIRDNDSSTHGSRTIDSRYSRDKTLGLSDEDVDVDDDEDDDNPKNNQKFDDDDVNDQDEYLNEEIKDDHKDEIIPSQQQEHWCTCGQQHPTVNENIDNSIGTYASIQATNRLNLKQSALNNNNLSSNMNAISSFKATNNVNKNQQPCSITLPIQQQANLINQSGTNTRANLPMGVKKLDINSSAPTTDNESSSNHIVSIIPTTSGTTNGGGGVILNNPNKIYSRKEVITTYKEETKNTHLEEYTSTTFYDTPSTMQQSAVAGVASSSLVGQSHSNYQDLNNPSNNNNNNNSYKLSRLSSSSSSPLPPPPQQSQPNTLPHTNPNNSTHANNNNITNETISNNLIVAASSLQSAQAPPPPPTAAAAATVPPTIISTTTTTTTTLTTTNKSHLVNVVDQLDKSDLAGGAAIADENDNDDEATKNDRCSIAAKIIYSNVQRQNQHVQPGVQPLNKINIERVKRPSSLIKPLVTSSPSSALRATTNNYNRFRHTTNTNKSIDVPVNLSDDQQFPPPPPIPHHHHHQHQHQSSCMNTSVSSHQPIMLQDYQEPMQNGANLRSNTTSNLKNPALIYNIEDEFKRKKNPMEESYYIVKELVMTERTYKKDLELLTFIFRQFAVTNNFDLSELLLFDQLLYPQALEPIYEFHNQFLKDLEIRLFYWTDKANNPGSSAEVQKIGDILINLNSILKNYRNYIDKYEDILNELELACKKNKKFDSLFKDFESQKICYLPFTMFLLKPIQRLIHYKILFERLLIYYGGFKHVDYHDTYSIFGKIEDINELINEKIPGIENKQKLMELQRDLIGVDNLITSSSKPLYNRYFVREGSLQKLSRKGYQQRMFFLFNDMLLYCARSSSPVLQFKVHGEYQLKHIQVEDGNSHINIPNSFTIYSSNRSLLVAAVSQEEKSKWLQDLYEAIEKARTINDDKQNYSSLKSNSSSDNNLDVTSSAIDNNEQMDAHNESTDHPSGSQLSSSNYEQQQKQQQQQHRANTTMHVCWHRNTSVSAADNHRSMVNQLSGYLLRKFKNSNGWQKLWVVFTNFCLFFYKTYQDEFPLASLPLLGYTVTIPSESDNINKDFVFKLQFKNHVYFFRAESQYSYDRWLEVIESAAQKQCLFNTND